MSEGLGRDLPTVEWLHSSVVDSILGRGTKAWSSSFRTTQMCSHKNWYFFKSSATGAHIDRFAGSALVQHFGTWIGEENGSLVVVETQLRVHIHMLMYVYMGTHVCCIGTYRCVLYTGNALKIHMHVHVHACMHMWKHTYVTLRCVPLR